MGFATAIVEGRIMNDFRSTWTEQCEAAEGIREQFGPDKALGYLVGEKFVTALRYAHSYPDMAKGIPEFAARIREIFDPHELTAWFSTVRRLGPLGHTVSEEEYQALDAAGAIGDDPVSGAEEVLALDRARELLTGTR